MPIIDDTLFRSVFTKVLSLTIQGDLAWTDISRGEEAMFEARVGDFVVGVNEDYFYVRRGTSGPQIASAAYSGVEGRELPIRKLYEAAHESFYRTNAQLAELNAALEDPTKLNLPDRSSKSEHNDSEREHKPTNEDDDLPF